MNAMMKCANVNWERPPSLLFNGWQYLTPPMHCASYRVVSPTSMGRTFITEHTRLVSTFLVGSAVACAIVWLGLASFRQTADGPATIGMMAILILAIALREVSTRNERGRQTRKIDAKVREIEEKNRLLSLTETYANVGHWRLDTRTNEVFWSAGTFALHGVTHGKEPELEDAINFYVPEDREMVAASVNAAKSSGKPISFRARLLRTDGEARDAEVVARVEKDASGATTALLGVIRDRTDEETMQNNLRDARDEARALADTKSVFLAKMSHEIRTPMNGVVGFAQLLAISDLTNEQSRHVDLIIDSGNALQTLLNDILEFSKAEAGEIALRPEATDLRKLLARILSLTAPAAREKGINLTHKISSDVPRYIEIDSLRLRQILSNLLSNAVRFTDKGHVDLHIELVDGGLNFTVRDTGAGIDPAMQEAVFDPFTQDNARESTRRGGTGLGLAICRHLSELMGGALCLESAIDAGSTFTLTLPLVLAPAPIHEVDTPRLARPSAPCLGCSCRVLLAEDYDINQELMCDMARQVGVTMDVAEDGAVALEMVLSAHQKSQPYSMVFMDLQMPNMGGIEATRAIREAGFDAANLPIIATTANAFDDDVRACFAAGMQGHIAKPIDMQVLVSTLAKWLNGFATGEDAVGRNPADNASGTRKPCQRF